jgi:hypothetical protein
MTASPAPWIGVALLHRLIGDNEPLVGDLVEECAYRSRTWFWRQVIFVVLLRATTGALTTLREPQRLASALTSLAVFIVLAFQVVVAGSLLDDLINRLGRSPAIQIGHPEWLVFVILSSLPAAWLIGRAAISLHRRSRVATVLLCGSTAAIVAFVTLSVLSSEPIGLYFPSAARQTVAAMAFVLGLLAAFPGRCSAGTRVRVGDDMLASLARPATGRRPR